MSVGIDRVGAPALPPPAADQAAGSHGDGAFSSLLTPGPATGLGTPALAAGMATASTAAQSLTGVAWLEAGIADALARDARDKEARRHGRAMLQALGAVQLAMLGGDDGQARVALAALASTAGEPHPAEDPVLRLIMREIAVRAAVELARSESGDAPDEDVSTA